MCFVCKEKIGSFNNIEELICKPVSLASLNNGCTILHIRIRLMELVLHVSYKLALKKYRVTLRKNHIDFDITAIVHTSKQKLLLNV